MLDDALQVDVHALRGLVAQRRVGLLTTLRPSSIAVLSLPLLLLLVLLLLLMLLLMGDATSRLLLRGRGLWRRGDALRGPCSSSRPSA